MKKILILTAAVLFVFACGKKEAEYKTWADTILNPASEKPLTEKRKKKIYNFYEKELSAGLNAFAGALPDVAGKVLLEEPKISDIKINELFTTYQDQQIENLSHNTGVIVAEYSNLFKTRCERTIVQIQLAIKNASTEAELYPKLSEIETKLRDYEDELGDSFYYAINYYYYTDAHFGMLGYLYNSGLEGEGIDITMGSKCEYNARAEGEQALFDMVTRLMRPPFDDKDLTPFEEKITAAVNKQSARCAALSVVLVKMKELNVLTDENLEQDNDALESIAGNAIKKYSSFDARANYIKKEVEKFYKTKKPACPSCPAAK